MLKNTSNLKKNAVILKSTFYLILLISIFFLLSNCILNSNNANLKASYNQYIPAPPVGDTSGYANVDYEYVIKTIDTKSYWMFDWGDGTYSSWVKLEESDTSISQHHSWSSSGFFEVRVKHKDAYGGEGSWSPPLTVEINLDADGDGWIDVKEFSYRTNSTDPEDYPLDTDNDGIPDNSSPDGKYVGDTDDDNDGLSDTLEIQLGSDSKYNLDVNEIKINGITHYLINTKGGSVLFYNVINENATAIGTTKEGLYLIDFNNDGRWEYSYNTIDGSVSTYDEKISFERSWPLAIIAIVIIVILTIFVLFKKGVIYLYDEYVVEE